MKTGEAYICVTDDGPGLAKPKRGASSRDHSFTPILAALAGDGWRKGSEGIFTQVWATGENPQGEAGFRIRLAAHPGIADEVLRTTVPIIVDAGCPFKVIANTALLELAGSKWPPEASAGDFMTVYPPSQALFNDLTEKLQHAVHGIKSSYVPIPAVETTGRPALTPQNPWPGLKCFLPDESPYFFGREEEQLELAQRLERAPVTVVVGQEGVGKSSLLRAGLAATLDRLSFEPVYLRLECGGAAHPVQQVRDEINRVLTDRKIDGAPFGEGQTLHEYFRLQEAGWVDASHKPVMPVLIFDQFEEVLAYDGTDPAAREAVEAFWTQIAKLFETRGRGTNGIRNRVSPDSRPERNWLKVILSLRQDNLPKLLARRGQMPAITQNQFLLKPFNGRNAVRAVLGPGRHLFDPTEADTLAEQIVRRVGRETGHAAEKPIVAGQAVEPLESLCVEPALLSIFCQRLDEARKRSDEAESGTSLITATLFHAEAGRIISDFFRPKDTALGALPAAEQQIAQESAQPQEITEATPPQITEEPAQLQVAEKAALPQITEVEAAPQIPEVVALPQVVEAPTPPQITEEPAQPQLAEVAAAPPQVAEVPVTRQITEVATALQIVGEAAPVQIAEAPAAPRVAEVAAPPQVIDVPAPPQITEEATARQIVEEPAPVQIAGVAAQPQVTQEPAQLQVTGIQETPRAEEKALPVQHPERPRPSPAPMLPRDSGVRRLKLLATGLVVLVIIILAVMVVMNLEDIQRQQTQHELDQYISNIEAAKNTFKSAHKELTLAEANLAIKESNLLALTAQSREQELETRTVREQNSKLSGEQTNLQSRIAQLKDEKTRAELRLAQWNSLLSELTNQIASLSSQKEELEARNHALAVTSKSSLGNSATVPNPVGVGTSAPAAPASANAAAEKEVAAMESLPEKLSLTMTPNAEISARRNANVMLVHGECRISDDGINFQPLPLHKGIRPGAIIQTGKKSWCDLFIRRAGTTVRVAPDSEIKITNLTQGSQNGIPVVNTSMVLTYGRIFTVVRALVPGSTLEIRDATGRSVIEGGGLGSYLITAPTPNSTNTLSVVPLKLISQNGTTLITPGQEYSAKDGDAFSIDASTWEAMLVHLDELETVEDKALGEPDPGKAAKNN